MVWHFISEGTGSEPWRWHCVNASTGVLIKRSSRGFTALWECAEDAAQQGYARIPAQMATSFAAGLSKRFQMATRLK